MKFLTFIIYAFLGIFISSLNLFAQYDAGTIIHSETGTSNLNTINKNYIVVDFDGDTYVDIIMVKTSKANNTNQLTWYKGDGNGNFSPQANLLSIEYVSWGADYRSNEIFYTDMNEDGIDDIVFQNSETGFTTLLNDGQGNISA